MNFRITSRDNSLCAYWSVAVVYMLTSELATARDPELRVCVDDPLHLTATVVLERTVFCR